MDMHGLAAASAENRHAAFLQQSRASGMCPCWTGTLAVELLQLTGEGAICWWIMAQPLYVEIGGQSEILPSAESWQ